MVLPASLPAILHTLFVAVATVNLISDLFSDVLQAPAMFDSGSVFDSSGNEQDSQFTYPDMPAPGPMPAGFGPIRTLAGPQGPQGPHDAYAPLSNLPLLSSDSSPEPTRVAEGELQDMQSCYRRTN